MIVGWCFVQFATQARTLQKNYNTVNSLQVVPIEPIVAATVLSTLAHAPESSPDWSWEYYCQEEKFSFCRILLTLLYHDSGPGTGQAVITGH